MCINLKPKIPKVDPLPPPPVVKPPPERPKDTDTPAAKQVADPDTKAEVTYGSKPSDALLTKKKRTSLSTIPLNRSTLNTPGASQQGLGGTGA